MYFDVDTYVDNSLGTYTAFRMLTQRNAGGLLLDYSTIHSLENTCRNSHKERSIRVLERQRIVINAHLIVPVANILREMVLDQYNHSIQLTDH